MNVTINQEYKKRIGKRKCMYKQVWVWLQAYNSLSHAVYSKYGVYKPYHCKQYHLYFFDVYQLKHAAIYITYTTTKHSVMPITNSYLFRWQEC